MECYGTETRLADCPTRSYSLQNCLHSEVAGVRCMILDNKNSGKSVSLLVKQKKQLQTHQVWIIVVKGCFQKHLKTSTDVRLPKALTSGRKLLIDISFIAFVHGVQRNLI